MTLEAYIRILGTPQLELDGSPVEIPRRLERKLLAMLALNANVLVPADTLTEALWAEPPRTARQQVYTLVAGLRRILKPALPNIAVGYRDGAYRLRIPHGQVDLHRYQDAVTAADASAAEGELRATIDYLHTALALWRGRALDGLGGQYFEDASTRLDAQRLHTLEQLVDHRLRAGESAALIGELRMLIAEYPFHETFRASLMEALIRSGKRADALEAFEDARRVLVDELGLDPGPELVTMQQIALAGAPSPFGMPQSAETAASLVDEIVCFLPPDTADFTARASEMHDILRSLQTDSSTAPKITTIYGMGGAGKTTLALHAAHALSGHYPDGQFFVDLQGFTAGAQPLAHGHALEILLRQSGVPAEQMPVDVHQRTFLWRDRLRGRRVLIILDNAIDEAQVAPLLPNTGGAAVIVTSRRSLPGISSAALPLACMDVEQACELFARVVGTARAEGQTQVIAQVVEECGMLPLTVRIAATLLRDRTAWSAEYLLQKLRQEGGRIRLLEGRGAQVRGVARLSYAQLPSAERRAFQLLGGTTCQDFDAYSTAALMGTSVAEADALLESLLDESLLIQRIQGRYQLHDVIREYAHELWACELDQAQADEAISRLLDYYLCFASRLCAPLASRPYSFDPGLSTGSKELPEYGALPSACDLLAIEHGNISAMVELAAQRGHHTAVWQLACLFEPYLKLVNFGDGSESLFKQACASAESLGDMRGVGLSLFSLSRVAHVKEDIPWARELVTRALQVSRLTGDQAAELYQMIFHGTLLYEQMRLNEACEQLELALDLATADEDTRAVAAITNNLGLVYCGLGSHDTALKSFTRALACYELDPSPQASLTFTNIGLEHLHRGDVDSAVESLEEGLRSSRAPRQPSAEIHALQGLGTLARARNDHTASTAYCHEALIISREFGFTQMECEALIALGDSMLATGKLDSADQLFHQAQLKCRAFSLRHTEGSSLEGLAHVALARGRVNEARSHWADAVQLYPSGLAEIAGIRRHLESLGTGGKVFGHCPRCPAS